MVPQASSSTQGGRIGTGPPTSVSASQPSSNAPIKALQLPGASGPVSVDYLACDRMRGRVWVPVGNTGSVDVLDIASGTFTRIDGFETEVRQVGGKQRIMGPSSVSVGQRFVYVGNRATSEVCAIDAVTLKLEHCEKLPTAIDGVVYVASTKEVWVTMPRNQALGILDVSRPDQPRFKQSLKVPGAPEGYALDESRGLFYTNLEDKNQTLVIDIRARATKSTWSAGCGADGPRGIAVDTARNLVIVACTDKMRVLAGEHHGAALETLDTGAGLDNIEYVESTGLLYAAAARASRVTVARLNGLGQLVTVATTKTVEGTRNAVVDARGNIYAVDAMNARLLVIPAQ